MSESMARPQRQDLRFCKAFFEILDRTATCRALDRAGAVEFVGGDDILADRWYRWDRPEPAGDVAVSFLVRLTSTRLVLEGPTPESVGRGWRVLDELLQPHARARVAAGDDLGRFLPRPRKHSADRPESWSKEHERRVLQEFYAAFVRRWTNLPHPRLDGRTPRQAATDPALAPDLERLLQRMARVEEERRARGIPGISVDRLRAALEGT